MKLHYGGTPPSSSIQIFLEPMRCTGKMSFYPSELATAERNLLKTNAVELKRELMERIDFIAVSLL